MIGVTIGVGNFHMKTAKISAECLKEQTGLDTIILTEDQFKELELQHPSALRLKIFDLVDSENILYFDADWFCVNKWDPLIYKNNKNIIACHDFVLWRDWPFEDGKRLDYEHDYTSVEYDGNREKEEKDFITKHDGNARYGYINDLIKFMDIKIHYSKWINAGFFIVNRTNHKKWLEHAEDIYRGPNGHHHWYFEQPSLIKSYEILRLEIDFLPRKYNVLTNVYKTYPINTIGIHLKLYSWKDIREKIEKGEWTRNTTRNLFLEK